MQTKKIKLLIALQQLTSTHSLIVPIKTLFIIHFLMQNESVSFLKFIYVLACFCLELPSGYFSDKFGNKNAVWLSKGFTILSLGCSCLIPSWGGLIIANILLGLADSFESGAKNTYFLILDQTYQFDYKKLLVSLTKYAYVVNFVFMIFSSVLYHYNIFLPYVLTVVLFAVAGIALGMLPNEPKQVADKQNNDFVNTTKDIAYKICTNKQLLLQLTFYIICSSILIANFDYFAIIFEGAGIDITFIGIIYSTFMMLSAIGVQIYQLSRFKWLKQCLLLLLPVSFLLLVSGMIPLILVGVVLQQLCFSYYSMNFEVYVLASVDDLTQGAYFQSTVAFINTVIRLALTAIITLLFSLFPLIAVYVVFAVLTAAVTCVYFLFRVE